MAFKETNHIHFQVHNMDPRTEHTIRGSLKTNSVYGVFSVCQISKKIILASLVTWRESATNTDQITIKPNEAIQKLFYSQAFYTEHRNCCGTESR